MSVISEPLTEPTGCTLRGHDGTPLACDCLGAGEPLLLFVHGWTCRRSYWAPQISFFGRRQAVAAIDLPGHGHSSPGERETWTVSGLAADVAAGAKELKAGQVILVGHSMGGAVAMEAARQLAGLAAAVVLVDTFVIDYGGLAPEVVENIFAPFADDFPAAIAGLVEQTSTAATPLELKRQLIREMSQADPAWALPLWRDLLNWNPAPAFAELQIPLHAINGALIPESARQRCAPFVGETIVPGAGHFLQMEDPAGFNRVLAQVLAESILA
ncbi:alpha/beta fold hydrolase [Desulfurivibrio alkaliphilus]|uniref:Alpha/beta hydrolase fold protein n=1 Tax=Desulfurivibrio alkaliphilus (strain DSM 19089 / UNIQEM U267 / AHT2) TaxID=589865 RepID=D6Z4C7_DESAT|nr:alpha/beta hydrolase [Desulfurivibrio alkaliphilus]ADH86402.1 alpha/beta hydrolase fold protein [Desulfurivibrio alkaliphilus AHT 2]